MRVQLFLFHPLPGSCWFGRIEKICLNFVREQNDVLKELAFNTHTLTHAHTNSTLAAYRHQFCTSFSSFFNVHNSTLMTHPLTHTFSFFLRALSHRLPSFTLLKSVPVFAYIFRFLILIVSWCVCLFASLFLCLRLFPSWFCVMICMNCVFFVCVF